jgi:hypothetical protein
MTTTPTSLAAALAEAASPAGLREAMDRAGVIAGVPEHPDPLGLLTAGLLLALVDRLDTFAAEIAATVEAATSGGLLGLITGGHR